MSIFGGFYFAFEPSGVDKYFGLTAHTGEVMPDEHVIYSVKTTDYSPSNADLNNVRKQWLDSLEASQQKEGHQNMDQNHFQHTVLTTINQMQVSYYKCSDQYVHAECYKFYL